MIEPSDMIVIQDMINRSLTGKVSSFMIPNNSVKQRHIGEGVRYIQYGLAAERPATDILPGTIFFATDTFVLSVYTGTTWKTATLT